MKKILIFLSFMMFYCSIFAQEPTRMWKSKTGKVVAEAVWDAENDAEVGTVFLKKDGKRFKYPFEKLSDADQKYVAEGRAQRARRGTDEAGQEADPDLQLVEGPRDFSSLLPTAKKYAVLVGVTEYASMNGLRYTVHDVEAIREQLLKMGFPDENIFMLTSGSKPATMPTKMNVERTIQSVLVSARLGDLVFLAFAGHGAQMGDTAYFCTQDTFDDDIPATAVSITQIMDDLSESEARFKWIVVDACRNNPFNRRVAGVRSIQKIDNPPKGIALFQSCAQNEVSYEDESLEHGVFTSKFVEGMAGAADVDRDGVLTFLEVCKYTTDQTVQGVQEKFRASQRPYLTSSMSDFVLTEDLDRPKAAAFYKSARDLCKNEKYDDALVAIDNALKLYPQEVAYLEEKETIQKFIKLLKQAQTPSGNPAPSGSSAGIPAGRQIRISNSQELHNALNNPEDGTVLVLAEGRYDLSEFYYICNKRLSIYGNPARPESVQIRFAEGKFWCFGEGSQGSIQGVDVSGEHGISIIYSGTRMTLENCRLQGNGYVGCVLANSAQAVLRNCVIHDCGKWGICCSEGCLEAENCQIFRCKDDGIYARGASSNLQVTRCQIQNNKCGVCITSGASGTFRENTLIGNGDYWYIADDAGHLFRADNITNE